MARFLLKEKHYINIVGNEWEREETNQATGKKLRQRFAVPQYLDPDDSKDHNSPEGIIVSTKEDRRYPRDLIFTGLPTPDMMPLDDEAEAMLEEYKATYKGEHPIDSLPVSLAESIAKALEMQIESMGGREKAIIPNTSLARVEELEKSNAELKAQLAEILSRLEPKSEPAGRRV